ncbi:piggyBac transposable element-derived protein 4-like, partial [Etheostoma spectabile]|uniref:piggyBac transposable element-derived protein 4-like n=1 Tax=Etheostoma spectabile TaxID=54343 RepID=UPI0013AF56BC
RCAFRQYMPSKPARYGLKSWVACDAGSSYAWHMQLYTGKSGSATPERNLGARVMLDLTEGLRGPRNPELPGALLATKGRAVFSSKFAFTPVATLVSYVPKRHRNVVLLST